MTRLLDAGDALPWAITAILAGVAMVAGGNVAFFCVAVILGFAGTRAVRLLIRG